MTMRLAMTKRTRSVISSVAFLTLACESRAPNPVAPSATGEAWVDGAASSAGARLVGDVVVGEYAFAPGDATLLASTCPASAGSNNSWSLDFGHSQCLIVRPDWNPASSYAPYALTDDVKLVTLQDKSSKRITHLRLLAQDVIGEAGIQHNTDWIPVAVPVAPSRSGGTLHVHAPNVEVWRLSGHTGGTRVEMVGWISIGDLVYR
jgi:hypothetical protein